MRKVLFLLPIALLFTGCSKYYSNDVQFSENHPRESSFHIQTFEEQHATDSAEADDIKEIVENGYADVQKNGAAARDSIEQFSGELDKSLDSLPSADSF